MGYKKVYYQDPSTVEVKIPPKPGITNLILVVVSVWILISFFPINAARWKEALLPWTNPEVQEAYASYCSDVASGEGILGAVEDLYHELIDIGKNDIPE